METPCAGPGCHARRSLVMCGGCRVATYCDAKCAERAWISGHALRCGEKGNLAAGVFGFSKVEKEKKATEQAAAAVEKTTKQAAAAAKATASRIADREAAEIKKQRWETVHWDIKPATDALSELLDINRHIDARLESFKSMYLTPHMIDVEKILGYEPELARLRGIIRSRKGKPLDETLLHELSAFEIPHLQDGSNKRRQSEFDEIKTMINKRKETIREIRTRIQRVNDAYPFDVQMQKWVADATHLLPRGGYVVDAPRN